jgi:hypothetical protein
VSRPTRALVDLVIRLVAEETGVSETDIITFRSAAAIKARWRAWAWIIELSSCTTAGLAHVWGSDRQAIHSAMRKLRDATA